MPPTHATRSFSTGQTARSPLLNLAAAAGCGYGAYALWQMNLAGHNAAGIGALVAAALGLRLLFRSMDAYGYRRRVRRAMRAALRKSDTHGRSRWGNRQDTRSAGMHTPGGFLLGAMGKQLVYHHGEGSIWCYAPPGTGKTVGSVIPNLLFKHTDQDGRFVSMKVLDLTGEIYAVTARRMRELGYNVVAVSPWADMMGRELGIEIADAGFNPTLPLIDAGEDTKDLAEMLGTLILPGQHQMSESASYFLDFGRSINVWGLMVLAKYGDPRRMNLVELRRLLMSAPAELDEILAVTSQSDAFGGALKQYADKLIQTKLNAPEEWSGAINTATKALNIYDDFGTLGRHVSATEGFQFTTIKDRPTCAYLMIPPERVASHAAWLNLAMSSSIEQIARSRNNRRVICLYDEFANAGYLPNVLKALGLYRKAGLQFAFYSQTASQIRRLYGDDGLRDFMGMCEVVQAFGTRDPQTLRMLSELAGQDTVKEFAQNLNPDLQTGGQNFGFSAGASNQARALIRPEDIRTLPDDKQLVFYRNMPPLLMDKLNYLKRKGWRRWADPNPYYRA